MHGYNHEDEL